MFRTIATILFLAIAILLVMPWLVLYTWITRNPDPMYSLAMRVLHIANRIAGIRVRVEGLANIPPATCIFASNHASNIDPIALVPAVPRRVALLAKKQVFRIPILATALLQAHFVPVDREDREAAAASVDRAVKYLSEGLSFCVYPEGTRSRDGRVKPFKRGTFVMAIQAGVPVVPVSLAGTQNLMRKGSWFIQPGEIVVRFGPAVDSRAYSLDRRSELLARVHEIVAAGLPPDQQPLPEPDRPASSNPS
ncbi:MAG: lysophospholipid acyltransferase family protein [Candidatus Acidiferrales bacterium]